MTATTRQQLEESLLKAKTALKDFGTGDCDDDMKVDDFKDIIAQELKEWGIPISDERIIAVAKWTVIGVEDNGIHIFTSIVGSIEISIDELLNNDF